MPVHIPAFELPNLYFSRTGATGYIGGDALYKLAETHPEYEIACLVRNSDKGAQVASQFVNVRLVYGDLASEQVRPVNHHITSLL